jgi:hypothetical protein
LVVLGVVFIVAGVVATFEALLERRRPPAIPFHNVLYPDVTFRPPANATWRSVGPSPSSLTREMAVEHTNADSLRIPAPDYRLEGQKPPGQIRVGMIGGSAVRIGTRYDVTLPGALKAVFTLRSHKIHEMRHG